MVNAQELRDLVNRDPAVRESLFSYHYTHGFFGNIPEYNARLNFQVEMLNPARTELLLNTYLPQYNAQLPQPINNEANPCLRRALTKAAVVGATGLAAIIVGSFADSEKVRHVIEGIGATLAGGAAVGAVIVYVKDKLK